MKTFRGDWVEAEIESVADDYPVVNLILNNGEKEALDIGYVCLKKQGSSSGKRQDDSSRSRSRSPRDGRKRGRESPDPEKCSKDELLKEFQRRQRSKAVAVGKDYAKRPSSFKSSLSSKMDHKHAR